MKVRKRLTSLLTSQLYMFSAMLLPEGVHQGARAVQP